jgi:hypothetical protein
MTNISDKEAKDKLKSLVSQLENLEGIIKEKQDQIAEAEQQKEDGYGPGLLYAIPSYRGTLKDIDIEELNQTLLAIASDHSNRRNQSADHVQYQDHLIEVSENGPADPLINEACSQIMDGFLELTQMPAMFHSDLWCVANGPGEQIFPHLHNSGDYEYAVVCWTQVPENSGDLVFFPKGLGLKSNETTSTVVPKAGDFFIFPGGVLHGVRHNASTEFRVSFSGNITADPREYDNLQNATAVFSESDLAMGDVVPLLAE